MTAIFAKRYRDERRVKAANAHWEWLAALDCGVRLPELRRVTAHQLDFEDLGHRQPGPDDLRLLARALGRLHATAYTSQLHAARLDTPHMASSGLVITDFVSPREAMLERIPIPTSGLPVALYKDANIRNFLLVDDGVAIVDFDDLTLAPFGYDLAKLIVSTAMTYGRLKSSTVESALAAYSAETAVTGHTTCSWATLCTYAEFHYLYTERYLGQNGYHHAWPDVRSWPKPEMPQSGTAVGTN